MKILSQKKELFTSQEDKFITCQKTLKTLIFLKTWYNVRTKERKKKWNKKRNTLPYLGFLNGF